MSPPNSRNSNAWQQLTSTLHLAAESHIPALILVEDFEMFVSSAPELQTVLDVLDGIGTPDNPAGTLLQLLKQPGSHFREVSIAATMRAMEQDRTDVSNEDIKH
jgi:hypothetical protein